MKTRLSEALVTRDQQFLTDATRAPYYPLAVKSARGSMVTDLDGNEFIDLLGSAAVMNIGHNHPRVVKAIQDQARELIQYTTAYMYHEPLADFARVITELTPVPGNKKVIFGFSGSDAADGAIKVVRSATGRENILAFEGSYHGTTYGSLTLTGISPGLKKGIGPMLPGIHHFEYPNCYRCPHGQDPGTCDLTCLKGLETALETDLDPATVAGAFLEPIEGDAGILKPPPKWMTRLDGILKTHGILLVVDEVQTGLGRTGKWFGMDHFDVQPDLFIYGKSLAAGMPLSAVVGRSELFEGLGTLGHAFTNGANPVVLAAALANIAVLKEENLIERSRVQGDYFKEELLKLKNRYAFIGDVRGEGLSIGIDLVKNPRTREAWGDAAKKISYRAWEKGLILTFFAGNVLRIQPPLSIPRDLIHQALTRMAETFREFDRGEIPDEVLKTAKGW